MSVVQPANQHTLLLTRITVAGFMWMMWNSCVCVCCSFQLQYSTVLDIVNNLLLYVEPSQKVWWPNYPSVVEWILVDLCKWAVYCRAHPSEDHPYVLHVSVNFQQTCSTRQAHPDRHVSILFNLTFGLTALVSIQLWKQTLWDHWSQNFCGLSKCHSPHQTDYFEALAG